MKKGFAIIFTLILVSAIVIAAEEDKDIKNPFSKLLGKLSEIKDVLSNMLEKLNIIAEKNTTVQVNVEPPQVTVEPNITVMPPEVIVNPNITLPEKECKWEKLNQIITVNGNAGGFVVPNGIEYSNVTFRKLAVSYQCTGGGYSGCYFMINKPVDYKNYCFSVSPATNLYTFYDITSSCLSELKEGLNNFSSTTTNGEGELKEIYVEMDILPSNC